MVQLFDAFGVQPDVVRGPENAELVAFRGELPDQDVAPAGLLGRYTALFDLSLSLGLTLGPALGGLVFTQLGLGYWTLAAAICLAAGLATWALEPGVPSESRRTPRATYGSAGGPLRASDS